MSVSPSVRPSLRMYQLASHRTASREIWYWGLLRKSVEKIQIWLKSDKSIGHFTWRPKYILLLHSALNRHKSGLQEWNGISVRVAEEVSILREFATFLPYTYNAYLFPHFINMQPHSSKLLFQPRICVSTLCLHSLAGNWKAVRHTWVLSLLLIIIFIDHFPRMRICHSKESRFQIAQLPCCGIVGSHGDDYENYWLLGNDAI
jgi:hypothetical protein